LHATLAPPGRAVNPADARGAGIAPGPAPARVCGALPARRLREAQLAGLPLVQAVAVAPDAQRLQAGGVLVAEVQRVGGMTLGGELDALDRIAAVLAPAGAGERAALAVAREPVRRQLARPAACRSAWWEPGTRLGCLVERALDVGDGGLHLGGVRLGARRKHDHAHRLAGAVRQHDDAHQRQGSRPPPTDATV